VVLVVGIDAAHHGIRSGVAGAVEEQVDAVDRVGRLQHRHRVVARVVVVGDQAQAEVIVRHPVELTAHAVLDAAAQFMAGILVLHVAATLGVGEVDAPGQGFAQHALGLGVAALAEGLLERAFGLEGRLARADVDGAAGGAVAVERALRAGQHGGAVDVQQVVGEHAGAAQVDVVEEQADAAGHADVDLGAAAVADATDGQAGVVGVNDGHVQAGGQLRQVFQALDTLLFEFLAVDDGGRTRRFLWIDGAIGHDAHGLETVFLGGLGTFRGGQEGR
jgi:hypothetical protein